MTSLTNEMLEIVPSGSSQPPEMFRPVNAFEGEAGWRRQKLG